MWEEGGERRNVEGTEREGREKARWGKGKHKGESRTYFFFN